MIGIDKMNPCSFLFCFLCKGYLDNFKELIKKIGKYFEEFFYTTKAYYSTKKDIYYITPFKKNKLICFSYNSLQIFNIINKTFIFEANIEFDKSNNFKLLGNNIICTYKKLYKGFKNIKLYELMESEENNEFSLNKIGSIPGEVVDILKNKNMFICFDNDNKGLSVYTLLRNKKVQLKFKFLYPFNYCKAFNLNDENIRIFEITDDELSFTSLNLINLKVKEKSNKCKYKYKGEYFEDQFDLMEDMMKLDLKIYNNKIILFDNNIFRLFYIDKQTITKIDEIYYHDFNINDYIITNNGEIYGYNYKYIFKLDLKAKNSYIVLLEKECKIKSLNIIKSENENIFLVVDDENLKIYYLPNNYKYNYYLIFLSLYLFYMTIILSIGNSIIIALFIVILSLKFRKQILFFIVTLIIVLLLIAFIFLI